MDIPGSFQGHFSQPTYITAQAVNSILYVCVEYKVFPV